MLQVLQNLRNGDTTVAEVPAPGLSRGRLIVHTQNTLISAGTEKMLVEFGKAGLIGKARSQPEKVQQVIDKIRTDGLLPTLETVFSKLGEPVPLGYSNVGIVTAVGEGVAGFEVGDRVVSNGPHAEIISVPELLCAKVPDAVASENAAFTVLSSIGLQGIRLAAPTIGETVVVYGLGLIGLLTVQILRSSGCRVIGIDVSADRIALAEQFGAIGIDARSCDNIPNSVRALSGGVGADAVLITASNSSDEIVANCAQMSRKRGRIVLIGVVGLNLNRSDFYEKELTFQVSCSYGPGRYDDNYEQSGNDYPLGYVRWTEQRNFEAVLELLSQNQLDVRPLISHRYEISDAVAAYQTVQSDRNSLGVVLNYAAETSADQTVRISAGPHKSEKELVAAVIGSGSFARATLIPAFAKQNPRIKYLVGRSNPASMQHTAQKFGCEFGTTDLDRVLDDTDVNLVVIATNHDSHARITCQALEAEKHVFVEKPLALNASQLEKVVQAKAQHEDLLLTVGFNRRFSEHAVTCKQLLAQRTQPLAINITVNAGNVPPDHWVHDPEVGGGRIIGEACHFLDLMVYLTGSKISSVAAHRFGNSAEIRDDKMAITLEHDDGSIGTLSYFANGNKRFPKESVEIYSEGRILRIENFLKTRGFGFSNFHKLGSRHQDKGHKQQFAHLATALKNGGAPTIPFDQLVNVTLASIAAVKSAHCREMIALSDLAVSVS